MRMALAVIFQLTNSFSRSSTEARHFGEFRSNGSGPSFCAPIDFARLTDSLTDAGRRREVTVVSILTAVARSSGPVTGAAADVLASCLSSNLTDAGPDLDALILVLGGAMVTQNGHAADLLFVEAARSALQPGTPIIGVFTTMANLSDLMVNSVDLALGWAPEYDERSAARAERVIRVSEELVHRSTRPATVHRKLPLLMPLSQRFPSSDPLRTVTAMAHEFESMDGVIDISLFPGFPYSDVPQAGFSMLVTTDGDVDKANRLALRLQSSIWSQRDAFVSAPLNVETAVHRAMLSEVGPVVIADAGDDPQAGGPGDGTGLLWALIDLGAPDAALGVIVDPAGVARAVEAGIGSRISIELGGSIDHRAGYPINVAARVRRIFDGQAKSDVGCDAHSGRAVVLTVAARHGGQIDVIVTESAPSSVEPALFAALGIDVATKKIVGVKASMDVQAKFGRIGATVLEISTPGITTPILTYLDFARLPRPCYPLDHM